MMKGSKMWSTIAIILSAISVVMAGVVNLTGTTIWIAGTQWILVGIVLGIYALYLSSCGCCTKNDQQ